LVLSDIDIKTEGPIPDNFVDFIKGAVIHKIAESVKSVNIEIRS
jgi:hypothetical protein